MNYQYSQICDLRQIKSITIYYAGAFVQVMQVLTGKKVRLLQF